MRRWLAEGQRAERVAPGGATWPRWPTEDEARRNEEAPAADCSTGAGIYRRVGGRKMRLRSLNLLQRLRRHGLLVPSMPEAAP